MSTKHSSTKDSLSTLKNFTNMTQVSVITSDTDAMVETLSSALGGGGFKVLSMGAPELFDAQYGGESEDWGIRAGLTWVGHMQLEIIQPLKGKSVFTDYLDSREGRAGIEHIFLDRRSGSLGDAIQYLEENGFPWQQEAKMNAAGRLGWLPMPAMPHFIAKKHGAHFGYTSTQGSLGVDIELAKFPPGVSQRLALRAAIPEKWVPESDKKYFEKTPIDCPLDNIDAIYIVSKDLDVLLGQWGKLIDRAPDVVKYDDDVFSGKGKLAQIGLETTSIFLLEPESGFASDILERLGEGVGIMRARPSRSLGFAKDGLEKRGWEIFPTEDGFAANHNDVPFGLYVTESF